MAQARTGRGIHRLPKVSPRPAQPDPYTPCGRATPQTALRPFGGWPAHRAGGLRLSSSPLDTPSRTGLRPPNHHPFITDLITKLTQSFREKRGSDGIEVWLQKKENHRNDEQIETGFRKVAREIDSRTQKADDFASNERSRVHEGEFHDQGDIVKKEYY
jgi:hypothetical protein